MGLPGMPCLKHVGSLEILSFGGFNFQHLNNMSRHDVVVVFPCHINQNIYIYRKLKPHQGARLSLR